MARCCNPVPGDEIVGYITRGRGATIHRQDCPNVLRIHEHERLVRVSWGEAKNTYPVSVRIKAYDRDGLMRDVSTLVANEGINLGQIKADVSHDQRLNLAIFDLILEVKDVEQLTRVPDAFGSSFECYGSTPCKTGIIYRRGIIQPRNRQDWFR